MHFKLPQSIQGLSEIVENYDGFLVDVWGVLHNGKKAYEDALVCLKKLRENKKKVILLSNAPRRIPPMKSRIKEFGITDDYFDFAHSSGEDMALNFAEVGYKGYGFSGNKCMFIGAPNQKVITDALDVVYTSDPQAADFILNAGPAINDSHTLDDFREDLAIPRARGIPMLCVNPDKTVHVDGVPHLCAGAVAALYEEMGGRVIYHGKPFLSVYEYCQKLLEGMPKNRILAIGDAFPTDILGASRFGIRTVITRCGLHADVLCGEQASQDAALKDLSKQYQCMPYFAMDELIW